MIGGNTSGADLDWVLKGEEVPNGTVEISEGVVSLEWSSGGEVIELRHCRPDGREFVRTIKADQKTVVTGMSEGIHHFQLRVPDGEWGGVMTVKNTFMKKGQVVGLLIFGGVVVFLIVGGIGVGMLSGRRSD